MVLEAKSHIQDGKKSFNDLVHGISLRVQYIQELIRRWDSERELFYDNIAHVFQNTKKENLLCLTN